MVSQTHPTEDHYTTLGVPPRSEASAIRAAYLDLMRQFHPDKNDTPEAVERAHAIIAAFAVLGYHADPGWPNTLPRTTGARHAVVAGKVTRPPRRG